jgi:hypothetical protein
MRTLLSVILFAVAGLIFSFFVAATVEAVTSWGVQEAFITMFCFWQNLIVFIVMNLLGVACVCSAIALLKSRRNVVAIS